MKKRQGLPGSLRASKSPIVVPVDPAVRVEPEPDRSPEVPRIAAEPRAPTENPQSSPIRSPGISFRRIPVVVRTVPILNPLPDIPRHVHRPVGALVGILALSHS